MTSYEFSLNRLLTSATTPALGLERITKVLTHLSNPQDTFPAIHVAGTNGKGSTCAFLSSIAGQSGLRVGLFTSPHLLCCRERIQINQELISESDFCQMEEVVHLAINEIGVALSFFEQVTALAFCYFAKQNIDLAIIEVGLGGRLDATNVITPKASVITRIDMDHSDFLGDSLDKIAIEKAGIIKPGIPIVTGFQEPDILRLLSDTAKSRLSPFFQVDSPCPLPLSLHGPHQRKNAALAIKALQVAGIGLDEYDIQNGLTSAKWPCRFEKVKDQPCIILDGAHNPAGMQALIETIKEREVALNQKIVFVLGTTQGHQEKEMVHYLLQLSDRIRTIVLTQSQSHRATKVHVLKALFDKEVNVVESKNLSSALDVALQIAGSNGLIIIAGSLYLAGEARGLFINMPKDQELPIF